MTVHFLENRLMFMVLPHIIRELKTGGLISRDLVRAGGFNFSNFWLSKTMQLNLEVEFIKQFLWYSFNGILQGSLDDAKLYWNTHRIRLSRHETVAGVPNILFAIPEQFGGFDFVSKFLMISCKRSWLDMDKQAMTLTFTTIFGTWWNFMKYNIHPIKIKVLRFLMF